MKLARPVILLIVAVLMLAACTPGQTQTPGGNVTEPAPVGETQAPSATPDPDLPKGGPVVVPDPASEAAQMAAVQALAEQLGLKADAITVTQVEAVDWPDSCLGVANPAEICLAVITPGYRILLEAQGMTYQVNTNLDGSAFRVLEQPTGGSGSGAADPEAAEQAARTYLAQQLGISEDAITLASLEAVDWPDSCLGVTQPGTMCAQVITPGFRIILEVEGQQYEFHTDQAGGQVAAALAPLPEGVGDVIAWEDSAGDECRQAVIGVAAVQYGACGAELESADLPEDRLIELAYFYGTFASFEGETDAGSVTFQGEGQREASEAEMRSVAEWAALVVGEVMPSRGESDDGLVITYHREGGFAGFCSDANVDRSGWVATTSCKGGLERSYEPYLLSGEELEQLYAWVDTLVSFEVEQKDAATADAMTVRLTFEGQGTEEASSDQQAEIMQFANLALTRGKLR